LKLVVFELLLLVVLLPLVLMVALEGLSGTSDINSSLRRMRGTRHSSPAHWCRRPSSQNSRITDPLHLARQTRFPFPEVT